MHVAGMFAGGGVGRARWELVYGIHGEENAKYFDLTSEMTDFCSFSSEVID